MLKGIDISNWQAGINIDKVCKSVDFIICKATEGTDFTDKYCDGFIQSVVKNGKLFGFYHFAGSDDAVAEADYFIKECKGYFGKGIPVLDWETSQSVSWVNRFVRRVHDKTGVWPWIYANPWRFNQGGVEENCARWVASYPSVTSPTFGQAEKWRKPYAQGNVVCWQFCSDGRLTGYSGNLDLNIYYGDAESWNAYAGKSGASKPSTGGKPAKDKKVTVRYAFHVKGGEWLEEVVDFGSGSDGFAGLPFHEHDLFYAKVDRGTLQYQAMTDEDGWLLPVKKGDRNDTVNGCAGIEGHAITGLRIYYWTPKGEEHKQAWYRAQTTKREGWLPVCCDDGGTYEDYDGWAGMKGEPINRLQLKIDSKNPF